MSTNEEQNQEGDWIWEPLPEDEETQNSNLIGMDGSESKLNMKKTNSEKSLGSGKNTLNSTKISSSPSFQELEKAIGATLSMSSGDSGELSERNQSPRTLSKSKSSSTDLTQQKLNQQRLRQQQHTQRYNNYNTNYRQGNSFFSPQLTNNLSARDELAPFVHESESRAIILFHSPLLPPVFIRNACSKSGVLYYIRPEFHAKGVTLISYFDLRAAISALSTIIEELGPDAEVSAHYSVMLHAANSNTEEFRLIVRNLPDICLESDVQAIFSRYGQLRSIQKTFIENVNSTEHDVLDQSASNSLGNSSKVAYSIEYYNIQDARLAASELSATSSTLWGSDATVTFAPLENRKQQLCRQLLSVLSRWRNEMSASSSMMGMNMLQPQQNMGGIPMPILGMPSMDLLNTPMGIASTGYPHMRIPSMNDLQYYDPASQQIHQLQNYPIPPLNPNSSASVQQIYSRFNSNPPIEHAVSQLSVNSNVLSGSSFEQQNNFYFTQQSNMGMPHKNSSSSSYKQTDNNAFHHYDNDKSDNNYASNNIRSTPKYPPRSPIEFKATNYYFDVNQQSGQSVPLQYHPQYIAGSGNNTIPTHHNGAYAQNHHHYQPSNVHQSQAHYQRSKQLNVNNVENSSGVGHRADNPVDINFVLDPSKIGQDDRTTIMVRNIPNKYNQLMILEEVNLHHEGTYDFFYLPIDFKNRCNVGYCFINFIDTKSIAPFIHEFNGKRWKSFNSEKVCAVSFARIQGKQAMIARFQNSSLLDKDDEFQPLLFYSNGPDVGKPEPFHMHKTATRQVPMYPAFNNKNLQQMSETGEVVRNHYSSQQQHHQEVMYSTGHASSRSSATTTTTDQMVMMIASTTINEPTNNNS